MCKLQRYCFRFCAVVLLLPWTCGPPSTNTIARRYAGFLRRRGLCIPCATPGEASGVYPSTLGDNALIAQHDVAPSDADNNDPSALGNAASATLGDGAKGTSQHAVAPTTPGDDDSVISGDDVALIPGDVGSVPHANLFQRPKTLALW